MAVLNSVQLKKKTKNKQPEGGEAMKGREDKVKG